MVLFTLEKYTCTIIQSHVVIGEGVPPLTASPEAFGGLMTPIGTSMGPGVIDATEMFVSDRNPENIRRY